MVRFLLSAALAGFFAMVQPAFADSAAATASDHAKAARVAGEPSTPQPTTKNSEHDKNFAAVGFGWG
jgi:hypothetical protein